MSKTRPPENKPHVQDECDGQLTASLKTFELDMELE